MPDLLTRLTELYWSLDSYGIDDRRRMAAVVREISGHIRAWESGRDDLEICDLMVRGIAARLLEEVAE